METDLFLPACHPLPSSRHRFQFYPVLLANIDPALQELILPLTWVQKEVIIPWVLSAKNRGYWEVSHVTFPLR